LGLAGLADNFVEWRQFFLGFILESYLRMKALAMDGVVDLLPLGWGTLFQKYGFWFPDYLLLGGAFFTSITLATILHGKNQIYGWTDLHFDLTRIRIRAHINNKRRIKGKSSVSQTIIDRRYRILQHKEGKNFSTQALPYKTGYLVMYHTARFLVFLVIAIYNLFTWPRLIFHSLVEAIFHQGQSQEIESIKKVLQTLGLITLGSLIVVFLAIDFR